MSELINRGVTMEDLMNKIHNIDCLEFMKQVPDNYFDLVLTDPPYGLGDKLLKGGKNANVVNFGKQFEKTEWKDELPSDEVFEEIFRISKNQIIWGGNYFNLPPTRGILCWDKNIGTPNNFSHFEMAWTSFDRPAMKHKRTNDANKLHPTMKPLKLIEFCLSYARIEKHHKIFDPFMGSGTTAVACKSLGLDWCGCELEADYVNIANKRLEKVQGSLF